MDTWREVRQMALEPGAILRDERTGLSRDISLLSLNGEKVLNNIGK